MKRKLSNQFLINFLVIFLLTILDTILAFMLLSFASRLISVPWQKINIPQAQLLKRITGRLTHPLL